MIILKCFLVGGCLCALFQILWMATKWGPGTLLKIGFASSALLFPLGIPGMLVEFGNTGFMVMIVGAGHATYACMEHIFAGEFLPMIELLLTFCAIFIFGSVAGLVYWRNQQRGLPKERAPQKSDSL